MAVCIKKESDLSSTYTPDTAVPRTVNTGTTEEGVWVESQQTETESGVAGGLTESQSTEEAQMALWPKKSGIRENRVLFNRYKMSETELCKDDHKEKFERGVTTLHEEQPGFWSQSENEILRAREPSGPTQSKNASEDASRGTRSQPLSPNGRDSSSESTKTRCEPSALTVQNSVSVGGKLHCCNECGKSFTKTAALTKHKKSHLTEKCYVCKQCGKGFTNLAYLKKHGRVHLGEKPHTCSECGQRFTVASSLKVHMRFHTGEKPYHCTKCNAQFFTLSTFKNHVLDHSGEKPNICHQCGKSFKDAASLRRHCHSDKPYSCSECSRSFTQAANLKIHMRIHSGEKPYSCTICGKCFTQKSGITIHLRTHSGEKPSTCDHCGKGFKHISYLKRHLKIHSADTLNIDETRLSECLNAKQNKMDEPNPVCMQVGQLRVSQHVGDDETDVCNVKCEGSQGETGSAPTTGSCAGLQACLCVGQVKTEKTD